MKSFPRHVFKIASALFAVLILISQQPVSAAGVNDFVVRSFDAKYQLSRDDKQGKLITEEKIALTYAGYNHGIYRAIPEIYGKEKTYPKVLSVQRDGADEPYTTSHENNNLVLKIGSGLKTITGEHEYVIRYSVENVIRFNKDKQYDELYWDVNGDQWQQQFQSVTAHFTPPADSPFKDTPAPVCYTGSYGSTEQACQYQAASSANSNEVTVTTTRTLQAGETLTAVLAVPKGYFQPTPLLIRLLPYIPSVAFVALLLVVVGTAYRKWRKYGKDYAETPVIAPAFGPPRGYTPVLAGFLYSDTLQTKYITATIIDLAIEGYIRIIEEDTKKLIGKKTAFKLELLKIYEDLSTSETEIMRKLFAGIEVGQTLDITSTEERNRLSSLPALLAPVLSKEADAKGLYELSPENAKSALNPHLLISAILVFLSFFIGIISPLVIGAAFVSLFVIIGLSSAMTRRSRDGVADKTELEGLKLYLSTAEKDRLAALQSANAPLAANAAEPVRTVELFEKLLPYAIVFGVEKTWGEAFKDLYTTPPNWYQGNWTAFNTGVFIGSLTSGVGSISASFTTPSSSNGSGFSGGGGGGFSGGGGGGGGGGGW